MVTTLRLFEHHARILVGDDDHARTCIHSDILALVAFEIGADRLHEGSVAAAWDAESRPPWSSIRGRGHGYQGLEPSWGPVRLLDRQDRVSQGVLGQSHEIWIRTDASKDLGIGLAQSVGSCAVVPRQEDRFRYGAQQLLLIALGHLLRAYCA